MGLIIGVGIICLSIIASTLAVVLRNFSWKNRLPKNIYRGVRFEFRPGCVSWDNVKIAIDSMYEVLGHDVVDDTCIWFWPYNEPIKTKKFPTGFIKKDGHPAAAPRTEAEAEEAAILNGLTEFEKKWPIGRATAFVHVRQLRAKDAKIDARLLRGTGPITDITHSALFHEEAEHVNPFRNGEGDNAGHSMIELLDVTRKVRTLCVNKIKQKR